MADREDEDSYDYDEHTEAGFKGSVYYLYVVGLAGIMVMAQGASLLDQTGCSGIEGYCDYAVALGVITTCTAIAMYLLIYTGNMTVDLKKYLSAFMFIWNAVGVGVTTFGYPFSVMGVTPNGYFGVWVSLLVSATLLGQVLAPTKINEKTKAVREKIRSAWDKFQEATMLTVLLVASIVVAVVGSIQCGETDCQKIEGFGVAYGIINFVFSAVIFYLHKKEPMQYQALPDIVMLVNGVWWVAGFLALTLFVNRFYVLGNGYLGALLGTVAAVNIAAAKQKSSLDSNSTSNEAYKGDREV